MSYATLIPVDSSAIRAAGYDGSTLTVEFHTGRVYDHPGVPYSVYAGLMQAGSKVRFTVGLSGENTDDRFDSREGHLIRPAATPPSDEEKEIPRARKINLCAKRCRQNKLPPTGRTPGNPPGRERRRVARFPK